jgi:hypothetical protein
MYKWKKPLHASCGFTNIGDAQWPFLNSREGLENKKGPAAITQGISGYL